MKSIVIRLQEIASNEDISIKELLRKALIVASKLNLDDFKDWIENEINGYGKNSEIPKYRNVIGEIKAYNPYNDIWIPFIWPNAPEGVYNRKINQRISEIEYNLKSTKGILVVPFSSDQQSILMKHFESPIPPSLIISRASLVGIIESVRNVILEWSLKLEKEGILGEKMVFSEEEQSRAANNQLIQIENFYGILGNTIKGTINQEINFSIKKDDIKSLLSYFQSKGICEEDLKELKDIVMSSPKPTQKRKFSKEISSWIGKMVAKASEGAWNIGINVATNLLIIALNKYFGLM